MINSTIASSAVNKVNAKVELYNGSTLVTTFTCNGRLQDFTVERVGQNNKFFGFGIIHKLTVNLIDLDRSLTITKDNSFKIYLGYGDQFENPYPTFYADSISRDENTNTITVVAYDILAAANTHTVAEVQVPYTIRQFAAAAITLLGVAAVNFIGITDEACLNTYYETGANFEGTESYKAALDSIAEVTQTIYYLDNQNRLIFKRLDKDGAAVFTISKDIYYDLESGEKRILNTIVSATELGDNISSSAGSEGVTQYIRNNPFWDLREDRATLLDNAVAAIGGISADQFYCDWDGNFLLEMGDKINIIAEDDSNLVSYLLNDSIHYDSTLSELSQWVHTDKDETASNPSSLGEVLKQTYAKVDKQNKTIELVAGETKDNTTNIAALQLTVNGISASVKSLDETTKTLTNDLGEVSGTVNTHTENIAALVAKDDEITASVNSVKTTTETLTNDLGELTGKVTTNTNNISALTTKADEIAASVSSVEAKTNELDDNLNTTNQNISKLQLTAEDISTSVSSLETNVTERLNGIDTNYDALAKEVSTKVTASDITVAIEEERRKGAEKVTTSTGFTFDSNGLTITKSDSEISTNIDEDGLSVYRYNEEVLTADNGGVLAKNLHATTYLIVGKNTYFADYGTDRAGCFWTGK